MIRRPPRSTLDRSSAASDVYKRQDEHKGVSSRTKLPFNSPTFSAIRNHSHDNDHPFNFSNFSILSQAKSTTNLHILETLHIANTKPSLNSDSGPYKLLLF